MRVHHHMTHRRESEQHPSGHRAHDAAEHHGGHHAHMVAYFRRRFWVSLILSIPALALAPLIQASLGLGERLAFPGDRSVRALLATIIYLYGGWPVVRGIIDELEHRSIDATKAQLTEQPFSARPPSRTIGTRQRPVLAFRPQVQSRLKPEANLVITLLRQGKVLNLAIPESEYSLP